TIAVTGRRGRTGTVAYHQVPDREPAQPQRSVAVRSTADGKLAGEDGRGLYRGALAGAARHCRAGSPDRHKRPQPVPSVQEIARLLADGIPETHTAAS